MSRLQAIVESEGPPRYTLADCLQKYDMNIGITENFGSIFS